jgi:hypothetical protein
MTIWLLLAVLCALSAAAYVVSLHRHPWVPCRWCKGGRTTDTVWTRAFGDCPHCGGRGRKYRLGVRMLGRDKEKR